MVYCDNCGYKVPDDTKFCPNCGKEIFLSGSKPSEPSTVSQTPYQQQPYQQQPYQQKPYQQQPYQHQPYQQQPYQQQMSPISMPTGIYSPKDSAVAAILSFFIPGLGQMYVGNIGRGVAIFFAFCCTIVFLIGIIVWIWGIFDANQQAKLYNSSLATNGRPPW